MTQTKVEAAGHVFYWRVPPLMWDRIVAAAEAHHPDHDLCEHCGSLIAGGRATKVTSWIRYVVVAALDGRVIPHE